MKSNETTITKKEIRIVQNVYNHRLYNQQVTASKPVKASVNVKVTRNGRESGNALIMMMLLMVVLVTGLYLLTTIGEGGLLYQVLVILRSLLS